MFDFSLRRIKDQVFDPITRNLPRTLSPHAITAVGFCCGLCSCVFAARGIIIPSIIFWLFNRALDCVDGSFARQSGQQSDFGGFVDLLADFIIYSLIPISCALGLSSNDGMRARQNGMFVSIMLLEASFHINNFVLFFIAAVTEKAKRQGGGQGSAQAKPARANVADELTSLSMRPALIEGFESGIFFTVMLIFPTYLYELSLCMMALIMIGIGQRVYWLAQILQY